MKKKERDYRITFYSMIGLMILLMLTSLFSCSPEEIEIRPTQTNDNCNCKEQLIQVTVDGRHIIQGEINVYILCSKNGEEFSKVYNGDRLIQYKKYNCN